MTKRRKRRGWSDDEKRMICGQTRAPGVSVGQVARRYDVNANLVFAWLRDPRFADAARFLPVEIVAEVKVLAAVPAADNHIEIELAGGYRMRIVSVRADRYPFQYHGNRSSTLVILWSGCAEGVASQAWRSTGFSLAVFDPGVGAGDPAAGG